ncbi:MAG: RNA polymerase sigma factor [Chitinophagaceae bacterium]
MTEKEIIDGCAKNNAICQRILFDKYAGRLMTICLRYASDKSQAEDILQNSFMRIFSQIQQFNFKGSFEGWLKKIVVNCALKTIQKKTLFISHNNYPETVSQTNFSALDNLSEAELIKLISSLPDGYKIVFNLYVMEGYSHEEIATLLNMESSTSRSQLLKARKLLQKQIIDHQKIAINYERK